MNPRLAIIFLLIFTVLSVVFAVDAILAYTGLFDSEPACSSTTSSSNTSLSLLAGVNANIDHNNGNSHGVVVNDTNTVKSNHRQTFRRLTAASIIFVKRHPLMAAALLSALLLLMAIGIAVIIYLRTSWQQDHPLPDTPSTPATHDDQSSRHNEQHASWLASNTSLIVFGALCLVVVVALVAVRVYFRGREGHTSSLLVPNPLMAKK